MLNRFSEISAGLIYLAIIAVAFLWLFSSWWMY